VIVVNNIDYFKHLVVNSLHVALQEANLFWEEVGLQENYS
jgi:hypothetical protein